MESKTPEGKIPPTCCGGGSSQETSSSCDCGSTPAKRCWGKTLIFVIIVAAAIGVGAYSLMATIR